MGKVAQELTAAEEAAAFAASKAYLDANVPGFERIMINDAMIQGHANAIVVAVDKARAAA